jgi:RHS repeat-associated protein
VQTGSVPTFGVTGELHDGAAGLVHLRARWYNARHGTFTAVDPFAGLAEQPYSQHPYQYAYSNPVLYTDPSGQCVPEGDGPDACDANFLGTLRAYLRNAQPFERRARAERGYLAANVVFDAYPDAARTYDPTTDPQLRRYIAARLWTTDVDATLATLDFALQQWRLDDAHRMGQPVDVRPVVASAGILGVLTGGPEDFCYLSPGGGGGGSGSGGRSKITKLQAPQAPSDLVTSADPLPVQADVSRSRVEAYADSMQNPNTPFDWNNMRDRYTGQPDPIIIETNPNGQQIIIEGHHRFLAAKLANVRIPDSAIEHRQRTTPYPQIYRWEDVVWTP